MPNLVAVFQFNLYNKSIDVGRKTWHITYAFKYVPQPASRPVNPGLRPAHSMFRRKI